MKVQLKSFQQERVAQLIEALRLAAAEASPTRLQAVMLSSPTGSGKTIMATAAIEAIIKGDEDAAGNPNAIILWITDQPEINEQSRRKMIAAATELLPSDFVVIGPSFNQELLAAGHVYFLNIQKLSSSSGLVTGGDSHTYTLWETLTQTVQAHPQDLFVMLDEAHRGMLENKENRNLANSIVQRFIRGSAAEVPPVPLVVGISATPDRFQALIQRSGRTLRPIEVSAEEVRDSGLLKDAIRVFHPELRSPSDISLLREAARSWKEYRDRWAAYTAAEGGAEVRPVLVVQVQDGHGSLVSRTDLAEAIDAIGVEIGGCADESFAHAFQEGANLRLGDRVLRYLAPADIADDPEVQFVFFKSSLNTGWDCPRAEIMMSFRTAVDATNIAQLIGRMVRAPLAHRIGTDALLNTVELYLPHYDAGGVEAVIERLERADEGQAPLDYENADEVVDVHQDASLAGCFKLYRALPSYVIPRSRKTSEVKRLMKLARLLANDDIDPDALDKATAALLEVLLSANAKLTADDEYKEATSGRGVIRIRALDWQFGGAGATEAVVEVAISPENIDDIFELAGRKFGEGVHRAYWRARCSADVSLAIQAKLEAHNLSTRPGLLAQLESAAKALARSWMSMHRNAIAHLSDAERQRYVETQRLASEPELRPELAPPPGYSVSRAQRKWAGHLYIDENREYPSTLNRWETPTLEGELQDAPTRWLRNPPQKDWAICVPYELAGAVKGCYPDFVVFSGLGEDIRVGIVDPHSLHLPDAAAKAAGLARYADRHALAYDRIELVIVHEGKAARLNLMDQDVRAKVREVNSPAHLRALFDLMAT
jgi:type III restriction enzyme